MMNDNINVDVPRKNTKHLSFMPDRSYGKTLIILDQRFKIKKGGNKYSPERS